MSTYTLQNCRIAGAEAAEDSTSITIDGGRIQGFDAIEAADVIDLGGLTVYPGWIDVHIHGAAGQEVNDASAEELLEVAGFLARKGVTAWLPTLVPASDEAYRLAIGEIDRLMDLQEGNPVAQALGVHYEGVFANEKMCGALRPQFFKKFTGPELSQLPRLKRGVHMTTFAPEIDGGIELVKELVNQGWIASIGHTRADAGTLDRAYAAGARHITHFFNAMTGVHHRDLGVSGWGLTNAGVTFDIIADGIHVDPKMLEVACRAKSPENVVLISDSVAPTGLGDGEYELWGEIVTVADGRTRNERGNIAGSVITMHDAVRRMLSLGFAPDEVTRMSSKNPGRLLGREQLCGSIEAGKRADLVGMDQEGSIRFVMIGGRKVHLSWGHKNETAVKDGLVVPLDR